MADPAIHSAAMANTMTPIPPTNESTDDTPMQDVPDGEVSPTSSDLENMSMISDDHYEHPDYDTEPEEATIVGSRTINDVIIDHGKRVGRPQDIGVAIFLAFPHLIKYEDDGEGNMFDDGLEDDQSEADSEASTNYEELTDPEVMPVVLHVPKSDAEDDDEDDSPKSSDFDDVEDDKYDPSDEDAEEENESVTVEEEPAVEPVLGGGAQGPGLPLRIIPSPMEIPQSPKKTFAQIQEQRYQLLYQEDHCWGSHKISLERGCDRIRWKLLELEEMKKRIDEEIAGYEERLGNAEEEKTAAEDKVEAIFEHSGISMELYTEYEAFCESLGPQYGQREGFSITCNADHDGSYVMYDPEFDVFKTCIEMPYTNCNFRSEAWTPAVCKWERLPPSSKIVEFWPIKSPIPNTGTEATWAEQYPELYDLAASAVRAGSEAALEMLVALPDMHSTFNGGWLFEYKFEDALQDDPVKAQRWRFDSAHKIDYPCTVEEKKKRIDLMLRPECVR